MVITKMERNVKSIRRTAGGISAAIASKIQVVPYEENVLRNGK